MADYGWRHALSLSHGLSRHLGNRFISGLCLLLVFLHCVFVLLPPPPVPSLLKQLLLLVLNCGARAWLTCIMIREFVRAFVLDRCEREIVRGVCV